MLHMCLHEIFFTQSLQETCSKHKEESRTAHLPTMIVYSSPEDQVKDASLVIEKEVCKICPTDLLSLQLVIFSIFITQNVVTTCILS